MADWGLYTALRGTDNWAQRRQDKMMNLQIAEKEAAREEARTQKEMLAEENINKYLDEMANLDVLPEDQERIKEVERKARFNIIKGIAENNGDLARYVSSGGISDLHEYKNSITQSEQVQNAMQSKENMGLIVADMQKGNRWFKRVEVEYAKRDKDGNEAEDKNGNPIIIREMVDEKKQLALFKKGYIDKIQYNGSEQRIKMNPMTFKDRYRDPKNPTGFNKVTATDVMFRATHEGASEEYAKYMTKNYIDRYNATGQAWNWKAMSPQEEALYQAKTNKANAAAKGGAGPGETVNYYKQAYSGHGAEKTAKNGTFKEWEGKRGVGTSYRRTNVSLDQRNMLISGTGLDPKRINSNSIFKDGEYVDMGPKFPNKVKVNGDLIVNPRTGKSHNLGGLNYTITNIGKSVYNIDGQPYLEAELYMDEDAVDNGGLRSEAGIDHLTGDWKTKLVEDVGGGGWFSDNYKVIAFIPINTNHSVAAKESRKFNEAQWEEKQGVNNAGWGYGTPNEDIWGPLTGN